ncbi:hypothetical protein BU23DRAFT_654410 [Bimuria novae-zelandiae CBS 107.79]|uniref:CoA-dependent acyltransferase n=1 Tax=Bimuria novae-zelandiae CBS 107.79 TaxID=1447943 RepID=A0A6A5VY26_9PLEO|nr:hypothetical protein BU23DRAFT_654410 [Bimuria novae-zelandiae CBS 107.79]
MDYLRPIREAAKSDLPLEWTQTSATTYERRVDYLESFFLFVGILGQGRPDKDNWYPTTAIRVETDREQFIGDVKAAWKALRYDHPILAATVEDYRWIYHLAEEQELSSWLDETFFVHETPKSSRQLFPFDNNPTKRAILHVLPQTQEIVLQGPHTHLDGIGMATFFNNLLTLMTVPPEKLQRPFGSEAANLTESILISAGVPIHTAEEKQAFDDNFAAYVENFPTMRLNTLNTGQKAKRTMNQWLTFTREETSAIAVKSKEHGFSVTSAAQAAVSHAARIQGKVDNKSHCTYAIYDARAYIDNNKYPHKDLISQHVFAMPAIFPVFPESFLDTARCAKEVFSKYNKNGLVRNVSDLRCELVPALIAQGKGPGMPVSADLQLSSLGIMDKFVKPVYESNAGRPSIEVHDIWVSLEILTADIAVEMWTFRGKLVIQLIYNEAFHREESVRHLLELIHEQLAQGLGVDLGFDAKSPGDEKYLNSSWKELSNHQLAENLHRVSIFNCSSY